MFKCPVFELGADGDTTRLVGIMDLADPGYALDESIIPPDDCTDTFAHYWSRRPIPEMGFATWSASKLRNGLICSFDLTMPFENQDTIVILGRDDNIPLEKIKDNTVFIRPFTVAECKVEYEQFQDGIRRKLPCGYQPYKTVAMVYRSQFWFNTK